jgi:hypothetical protein
MADQPQSDREPRPLSRLFAHIKDKDQRESLIAAYGSLKKILDESLGREIQRLLKESYDKCEKEAVYDSQNLVALLADQAGYRRALKRVLTLLP